MGSKRHVNKVTLIGEVVSDLNFFENENGPMVTFKLATKDQWFDKGCEKMKSRSEKHKIVCFGGIANFAENNINKGQTLYIEGEIRTNEWFSPEGDKRRAKDIIARNIIPHQ